MSQETKGELVPGVAITITPQEAGDDPPITIFHVAIEDNRGETKGVWCDTFGSKELLRAYLRGLEAGAVMIGGKHVTRPEVPFSNL